MAGGTPERGAAEVRPAVVVTVDLGNGVSENLSCGRGEDPLAAARAFCARHGIDPRVAQPLAARVVDALGRPSTARKDQPQHRPATPHSPRRYAEGARSPERESVFERLYDDAEEHKMRKDAMLRSSSTLPRFASKPNAKGASLFSPAPSTVGSEGVFERLWEDASEHKLRKEATVRRAEAMAAADEASTVQTMSAVSREMMRSRTATDYSNYGERLYLEGMQHKQQMEIAARMHKEAEAEAELRELRETPRVLRSAQAHNYGCNSTWERLAEAEVSAKDMHIERMRAEKAQREMEACTFKPKINKRSKALMRSRTEALKEHGVTYHDTLYQDADRRLLRKLEYQNMVPDDVTFHPKLNSKANAPWQHVWGQSSTNVLERLTTSHVQTERRLESLRKEVEEPVDKQTGQKLFKPRTGRAPNFSRNDANLPIGEFLYGIRHEFEDKKEYIQALEQGELEEKRNEAHTTNRSQQLVEAMKRRRFKQIFAHLDSDDRDGLVDLRDADLSRFEDEVIEDIESAAQLAAGPVNLEQFSNIMDHVITVVKTGPRNYILPSGRKKDGPEFTFQPQVSKHSMELAQRRRGHVTVEEALLAEGEATRRRKEQIREQLDHAEMEACTFKPQLFTKPGVAGVAAAAKTYGGPASAASSAPQRAPRPASARPSSKKGSQKAAGKAAEPPALAPLPASLGSEALPSKDDFLTFERELVKFESILQGSSAPSSDVASSLSGGK